jgi:hypothetical protein
MFLWLVSRGNNCICCQGHQGVKLAADGVPEEMIAALDGDWSEFTPAERGAFALARKLTVDPALVTDEDIERIAQAILGSRGCRDRLPGQRSRLLRPLDGASPAPAGAGDRRDGSGRASIGPVNCSGEDGRGLIRPGCVD